MCLYIYGVYICTCVYVACHVNVNVNVLVRPPVIKALFIGPYALERVVQEKADYWRDTIQEFYGVEVVMSVATPPFETDDLDARGYWLNPQGRDHARRVRRLKSEINKALVSFLGEVEKYRPRLIVGLGQGAVVTAMSSFPVVLERACRLFRSESR